MNINTYTSISDEITDGKNFLNQFGKRLTFFGSSNAHESSREYQLVEKLAEEAYSLGFSIVTGGGFGLMEAASKGSHGTSIAILHKGIKQSQNQYVKNENVFLTTSFSSRKTLLSHNVDAFIVCPGGFGSLDELFDVLTNMKVDSSDKRPVILADKSFWSPLMQFIYDQPIKKGFEETSSINNIHMINSEKELKQILV